MRIAIMAENQRSNSVCQWVKTEYTVHCDITATVKNKLELFLNMDKMPVVRR